MADKQSKTEVLRIRVTPEEKAIINNYATANNMSTSEFIRILITNYEQGQNLKNINFGIDKIIKQLEELKR